MTAEVETLPTVEVAASGELEVTDDGTKVKMNGEVATKEPAAPLANGTATENGHAENGHAEEEVKQNGHATEEQNGTTEEETPAENGAAVEANGDAAAETNGEAADEVTPEAPVEETPPKVLLHMHPPSKTLPTTSMFCLKLETYIRMHKIPYESHYGYKVGKNGKVPWIEYKTDRISDSASIIQFLDKTFEISPIDSHLSEAQQHIAHALQVMLEENTYWAVQYSRWVDRFNEFKREIAEWNGGGIGFNVNVKMSQRKVRSGLESHGLGRHTKEEVYALAAKDLKALSGVLGEQQYLFGDSVSTVDLVAFSLVAQITQLGLDTPLSTLINEECTNLLEHFNRIKADYWPDWDDVILADRPPQLKKSFSFRKMKKNKKPKTEENGTGSSDEAVTPAEGETPAAATEEEAKPAEATETSAETTEAADTTPAEPSATATEENATPAAEATEDKPEDAPAPAIEVAAPETAEVAPSTDAPSTDAPTTEAPQADTQTEEDVPEK